MPITSATYTFSLNPQNISLKKKFFNFVLGYHQLSITNWIIGKAVQFSSGAQSCPTLCDPMDCSIPGFLIHHQLSELAQTHVHWVSDATQPSHPLSSLSPPAFNLSIRVFPNDSVLCIRWPVYGSFSFSISPSNEYSRLISFRMDWLDLLAAQGTLKSLFLRHSSKASILWRFLYSPTLTPIHDYWKNHSFD